MKTYIALLRGINVGGHRKIRMAELREMFSGMGLADVQTYIQSGNVIFKSPDRHEAGLAAAIQHEIADTFGYRVPVIIRTKADFERTVERYPFEEKEGWRGYITFLSDQPSSKKQEELEALSTEIETFCMGPRVVYVHVNKQAAEKPLFSSNFIQQRLNIPSTNRNLHTIRKLLALA
ncbi:DUF1697 domain-containing protein [Fodinibius sediminis]|nr:DUF1697 domain-containing protein [Fodinibius sediminis]